VVRASGPGEITLTVSSSDGLGATVRLTARVIP
jgi:hypothetical protein